MKNRISKSESNNERNLPFEEQDSLLQAELWLSFYALARHWESDLVFFEDELNFFRILIDKNLSLLVDPRLIDQTRMMIKHVSDLERERTTLQKEISRHVQHIFQITENPFAQDAQKQKNEHARLEKAFGEFLKKFRAIKLEVFKLNEKIIHSGRNLRMIDLK